VLLSLSCSPRVRILEADSPGFILRPASWGLVTQNDSIVLEIAVKLGIAIV
jgi:hypothetical protein